MVKISKAKDQKYTIGGQIPVGGCLIKKKNTAWFYSRESQFDKDGDENPSKLLTPSRSSKHVTDSI